MFKFSKYTRRQLGVATLSIEIVLIISLFVLSAIYLQQHIEDDIQENMLHIAKYAAFNIDASAIKKIKSANDGYFDKIKAQLRNIENIYGLREGLAYIVEMKNGVPVFSVMSNKKSFRGHKYPEEITRQIHYVFSGKEKISNLYEDRNGSFISVLVPLYDGDKVVAALEIDFPGEDYKKQLYSRILPLLIGLFLLLLLSFTVIFVILLKFYNSREQEFKQTHLQLIQSEKMALLNRLVAGIAHEVNNPVSVITNTSDLIDRLVEKIARAVKKSKSIHVTRSPEPIARLLEILQKNNAALSTAGKRISSIVKSLKKFASLDEAAFKKTDINGALDNILTLIQHEIKDSIEVILEYGSIPRIYCYPDQLNQVFMSLLVNASQAIEEKGVIKLSTSSDSKSVYLRIFDTGRGIPPDKLDKLFDLNFTIKNSRVGIGMGLANACNIIQKHHGSIEVTSEESKGTEFVITLPINIDDKNHLPESHCSTYP